MSSSSANPKPSSSSSSSSTSSTSSSSSSSSSSFVLRSYAKSKKTGQPIYQTLWIPSSSRFVTIGAQPVAGSTPVGYIQVSEVSRGSIQNLRETKTSSAVKCGTFAGSSLESRHLATGDFQGNLNLWDLEHMEVPIYSTKAHDAIVHCIDGCGGATKTKGAAELVTSSKDKVCVWDVRQKDKPVVVIEPGIKSSKPSDCWAVCFGNSFNDSDRCVYTGYDNGDLRLFDLRASKQRARANVGNGICSLSCDDRYTQGASLLVTMLNSTIRLYSDNTLSPTAPFVEDKTQQSTVWCGRFVPQNKNLLLTTGGNGVVQLYHKETTKAGSSSSTKLKTLSTFKVSNQPVLSLDCHPDREGLCLVNSLDQSINALVIVPTSK